MKKKLVVLTGAGISAESGLATFRDSGGLWEGYNIMEVATPGAWKKNPELVLDFYNQRRRNVAEANPNAAHFALASLEVDFDVTVITQNIDDLHERAGSSNVIHLHGEIFKMRSEKTPELIVDVRGDMSLSTLAPDGARFRPHIVWFEEEVPKMMEAVPVVEEADIFAVIGTSLVVYPAAGLIRYTRPGIPCFVLDKKLPEASFGANVTGIEKTATEGINDLVSRLQQLR